MIEMRWLVKRNIQTGNFDCGERVLQYREQYHSSERVDSQLYRVSAWSDWRDVPEYMEETEYEY
jgi:hypothetical protein